MGDDEKVSDEAGYFASLFSDSFGMGSPKPEQDFLTAIGTAFAVAAAGESFRERHPDPVYRKKFADSLLAMFQVQWDQMLAKHREMMGSTLGKVFGGLVGDPDEAAAKLEEKAAEARAYLYQLAGVEA